MTLNKDIEENNRRLGDLLLAFKAIKEANLNDALKLAKRSSLPLERTLVATGLITEQEMETSLRLQTILKSTSIPISVASHAYEYVTQKNMTFEHALSQAGITGQIMSYSKLGVLLVDAKLIEQNQFQEARKMSLQVGVPLGRMLCLMGFISPALLDLALDLQKKMREEGLTKSKAIEQLQEHDKKPVVKEVTEANADSATIRFKHDLVHSNNKIVNPSIKLGELFQLLLLSEAITQMELIDGLERSLMQGKSIGEIFVESELLPESVFTVAVELQESVNSGAISSMTAVETLSFICKSNNLLTVNGR